MEEINAVPNTKRRKERGKGQRENPPEKGNDVLTLSHHTCLRSSPTQRFQNVFQQKTKSKSAIENVASYIQPIIILRHRKERE